MYEILEFRFVPGEDPGKGILHFVVRTDIVGFYGRSCIFPRYANNIRVVLHGRCRAICMIHDHKPFIKVESAKHLPDGWHHDALCCQLNKWGREIYPHVYDECNPL